MKKQIITFKSIEEAYGELPYPMTNDYMFRAVLQRNNRVLCGLLRSLLHIPPCVEVTAEITNPIVLGESVMDKEFRLDINLILNQTTLMNLEMQVANKYNWKERSLAYLCRAFDQLNLGDEYTAVKPVIHIGFLDYSLFPECPEFYAVNKMMNIKNHRIYSDKLDLRVVDLTQIHMATQEDKQYHIDYWAKLFKATTWEELRMLAEKDEYISEATKAVFQVTTDEQLQKLLHDRREYNNDMRYYHSEITRLSEENEAKEQELTAKEQELTAKEQELTSQKQELTAKEQEIEALKAELARLKGTIEK